MKVISTATQIGQAFKNAGRVTEIIGVFVSHGFADLVHRIQLSRFLPIKYSENPRYKNLSLPKRLRLSFEELGPTFIKLGQLLATRADLVPESYVEEFQILQDRAKTIPTDEVRHVIESELKCSLGEVFESFEENPIAAASIAQVHGAQLKDGRKVAVKVQRPGIEKVILSDISILRGLAFLLEKYVPETRPFNPSGLVDEFFQTIQFELDFLVEANNIRKIKKNLENLKDIVIPEIFTNWSTPCVLVLERFEGVRFSDREAILRNKIKPEKILEAGCDAFFQMVMQDGVFHGDLHAGNLFVLPDGRIGIIDFGIVGRLGKRVQDSIITIFIGLMDEDYDTIASEYVNLCQPTGPCDVARLQKDLMDAISPYVGMALGEVNIGKILLRSTHIAVRHNLQVPRELMLLFRAMVTIEALGKKLDPSFDLLQLGTRLARQTLARRYSKDRIMKDLIVIGREVQELLEMSPRLFKRALRLWGQNNFVFETRSNDLQALGVSIRQFTFFFVLCTLSTLLFAMGVIFTFLSQGPSLAGIPLGAVFSFGMCLLILSMSLWSLRRGRE